MAEAEGIPRPDVRKVDFIQSVDFFKELVFPAFFQLVLELEGVVKVVFDAPLVFSGDDDKLGDIARPFAAWKGSDGKLPDWPEETKPMRGNLEVEVKNDKTSAALFVGTPGLTIDNPQRPTLDVLAAVISGVGYPSGRLHQALRGGDEDLVYAAHGFPFYGVKGGFFGVVTQTTMANLARVQEIVLKNLDQIVNEPVPDNEFQAAKDLAITMQQLRLESLDAQAQSAAVT